MTDGIRWLFALFGFDVAHPLIVLLLPLALVALWWSSQSGGRLVFSSLRALPAGGKTLRTQLAWVPDLLYTLAVVAFVIGAAGPQRGVRDSRVRREGIAIMMAVDVSGSMRALDLSEKNRELTRLDAVKQVFEQFVLGGNKLGGRVDDAIGLVAFARYAETRSPLTLDHGNLVSAARQLEFAPEDEDGTAIGAGLELAVQRLSEFKTDTAISKVAILLTDGESNVHDIDEDTAIEDAQKAGIKVYAIGAGTTGIAPVRVEVGDGRTELVSTRVSIDEATLRKIADKTGGRYFRATDHASLEQIYAQIDKLERAAIEENRFLEYDHYFPMLVLIGLGLVALALTLRATVLRRLP